MYKLNKIRGFVAMPVIIGSAILAIGVLSGLAYEYKNDQSVLSSINKNNLLAQVSETVPKITSFTVTDPGGQGILPVNIYWSTSIPTNAELTCKGSNSFIPTPAKIFVSEDNREVECNKEGAGSGGTGTILVSYTNQNSNVITIKSKGNLQYIPTEFCLNLYKEGVGYALDGRCISITLGPDQSAATTPNITVTSPNGGEQWKVGETRRITWSALGVNYVKLGIRDSTISGSGSVNYLGDGSAISADRGYFDWTIIQNQLPGSDSLPRNYTIGISGHNNALDYDSIVTDTSDNLFTITAPVAAPTINIYPVDFGPVGTTISISGTGFASDNVFSFESNGTIKQFSLPSNGESVRFTIPKTVTLWSEAGYREIDTVPGTYQISLSNSNGKSNLVYFTVTAPQPTCTPATSCVSQYCQYGGDLKKCTVNKTDCSTSSYTTGGCKSAPSISTVCDSTAKAIVDSVGGCAKIDRSLYSNIYDVCCVPVVVTEQSLLSMLNTALADRFIDKQEATALLIALNSYLK